MSNVGTETALQNTANNQVTAPAAATSNAASIIEQKEPLTTSASRRRAPSAPIWNCLTAARRMFNNLPSALQSTETKRMCLKEAAERTYGDPKRASYDIRNEARKLTNLLDFGERESIERILSAGIPVILRFYFVYYPSFLSMQPERAA